MGSALPEIGLNLRLYATRTANGFLKEAMEAGQRGGAKAAKLEGYVRDLEAERRKIEVFKRELPLSVHLLSEIISMLKEELERSQKSSVFEEFMPVVRSTIEEKVGEKVEEDSKDKKSWMSSAQLWSHSEEDSTEKPQIRPSQKGTSCGFMPFKGFPRKEEKVDVTVPDLTVLSYKSVAGATENSTSGATRPVSLQSQAQSQAQQRKTRRCWSPELHRRFVSALQQLGGAQVATPKQIRELMKVDGLTNDEVKSHLQKYRLHTRRTPANNNASCKDQQSATSQQSTSQSGSPTGPLQLAIATGGAAESYDEEDERSDSYDWKL